METLWQHRIIFSIHVVVSVHKHSVNKVEVMHFSMSLCNTPKAASPLLHVRSIFGSLVPKVRLYAPADPCSVFLLKINVPA